MTDPFVIPGLVESRAEIRAEQGELHSLRRQLQREQEARRLAEQLAGQGIDEVLHQQRELMLLGRVAVAANEATSLASAVGECLSLVSRHAGWPVATMWIRQPDDPHLHPTGAWHREPGRGCDALAEAVASRLTVPSASLPGIVATSGAPQWFDGLQFRTNWLRDDHDDELGVATALAVPVWAGRDVVGVVALFHDQAVARDEHLLELTEQVVTQLGVAVRRFTGVDEVTLLVSPAPSELLAADSLPFGSVSGGEGGPGYGPCPSARAAGRLGEVAHQVRTPLHGLIGNLELLCESGLDDEQRDLGALALQSAIDLHRRLEAWLEQIDAASDPLGD